MNALLYKSFIEGTSNFRPGTFLRLKLFLPYLDDLIKPGQTVLDIGGFDGIITSYLKSRENIFAAILDLDVAGLQLAKEKGISTINGSAVSIPVRSDSIDGILSLDNIEHIINDVNAAKEMARILKPGGWLFLSTTGSNFSLPFISQNWIKSKWGHVRVGYSKEDLNRLLIESGLIISMNGQYNSFLTRLLYVLLFYFRFPPSSSRFKFWIFSKIVDLENKVPFDFREHWLLAIKL